MDFLAYFCIAAISFSGFAAGAILAFHTVDELPTGRKYLNIVRFIIFASCIFIFVKAFDSEDSTTALIILAVTIGYSFLLKYILRKRNSDHAAYLFFGLFLGKIAQDPSLMLVASLVFIYGIASGTIFAARNYLADGMGRLLERKEITIRDIQKSVLEFLFSAVPYFLAACAGYFL
jgi:hypothetical protein